jgi:hypothetical protein
MPCTHECLDAVRVTSVFGLELDDAPSEDSQHFCGRSRLDVGVKSDAKSGCSNDHLMIR